MSRIQDSGFGIQEAKQGEIAADKKGDAKLPETPEIGGRSGPDPTRYGDYEVKGKCVDF